MASLNIIIYSKDRACQLEFLLRSIKKFFKKWNSNYFAVIYTYSDKDFRAGYEKTKKLHPEFEYICEKDFSDSFRNLTVTAIKDSNSYTMFLVDDDVFKEDFTIDSKQFEVFVKDNKILCLSLRMHKGVNYSYVIDKKLKAPKLSREGVWNWKKVKEFGAWSYPMSLDGHIFRTEELKKLAKSLDFNNPNTFEKQLSTHPFNEPEMICYSKSKIINIPCNKVQDVNNNRYGGISAKHLNNMFLSEKRLSFKGVKGIKSNSPHKEVELKFEKIKWLK